VSQRPILLVGAGGHARACIAVIEQDGRFAVAGLVGRDAEVGGTVLGYPVIGTDDEIAHHAAAIGAAVVVVGQIKTAEPRRRLFALLERTGCELPVIVSPRAYVSAHAAVGAGTVVLHGAVVNAAARVGRNCIVNSLALVEHDAIVGDHCHIATGARLNSAVRVGEGSFIGSGASLRQGIVVGEGSVIGMGQAVLADCPAGTWVAAPKAGRG
jgi:sugar O-acyltransferase (sialic acid O-acetyltransferase NeuD family)